MGHLVRTNARAWFSAGVRYRPGKNNYAHGHRHIMCMFVFATVYKCILFVFATANKCVSFAFATANKCAFKSDFF